MERTKYQFTYDWFEGNILRWQQILLPMFRGRKLEVLEIGSFEGASTTWILDNLLGHPQSKIVCIDTFMGGLEHQFEPYKSALLSLEQNFHANILKTGRSNCVQVLKDYSFEALIKLNKNQKNKQRFSFIYIDGSHVAKDVLTDAILSWTLLKDNGILIFDDFLWEGGFNKEYNRPKIAITAFLECYKPEIELIYSGWQIIIKKTVPQIK